MPFNPIEDRGVFLFLVSFYVLGDIQEEKR